MPFGHMGRSSAAPMIHLFMLTQHSVKARFAGNIDSLIGQPRHDLGRRPALVLRTIAYGQYPFPFLLGERLGAGVAGRTHTPVSEGVSSEPAGREEEGGGKGSVRSC